MKKTFQSIGYKLLSTLVIATTFPMLVYCFFFSYDMRKSAENSYIEQTQHTWQIVSSNIEHSLSTSIDVANKGIYLNGTLQDLLFSRDGNAFSYAESANSSLLFSYMTNIYSLTPVYSGSLEIKGTPEGLVLVNDLFLEDYLTKVVPSEMPPSYEKEALKAQAVCARTYAYRQIQGNTYSQYGAHVDDSTNFQVYNNTSANDKSTQAVKETYGKMLFYEDKPIEAFYFSTSCGRTADAGVWGTDSGKYPYLRAVEVKEGGKSLGKEDNDGFESYIKREDVIAYDTSYPMFRWQTDLPADVASAQISGAGQIQDMTVTDRGPGGIAGELTVTGSDGTVTIKGQSAIRSALGNPSLIITKKDGGTMTGSATLPSAFIAIEKRTGEDGSLSFHIYGGGFGHGVGMSQNGAQGMAKTGKGYKQILDFFYHGTELRECNEG